MDESMSKIVESWNNRIKITPNDLLFTRDKNFIKDIKVSHRIDLANKYLGHFVSHCDEEEHINILRDE